MFDDLTSFELQEVRPARMSDLVPPEAVFSVMRERIAELGGTDDFIADLESREGTLGLVEFARQGLDSISALHGVMVPAVIVVGRENITVEKPHAG